ncbi:MAG: hypothetical protein ACR2KV_09940 [Solirubrobacteraceae bacterium]
MTDNACVIVTETPHTAFPTHVMPCQTRASDFKPGRQGRVPLTMPRSQKYYWTARWQRAERATLATIDAGDSIVFDSEDPEDIVRWLHTPDEPDADQD